MKKITLLIVLSFVLFSTSLKAAHCNGGELYWECLSNGNYRFHLKIYSECYAQSVTGNNQTLFTTIPNFPSINLYLVQGWPKNISPKCYNPALELLCDTSTSGYITGATVEFWYTSDSLYPNGVMLSGVPPLSGWMFYNENSSRSASSNIPYSNSLGYRFSAVMYPHNNQNTFPCFDNAPTFAEPPRIALCTGFSNSYSNLSFDKDGDSLVYSWGIPKDMGGAPIFAYSAGYSYNLPFPGATINAANIPASLDANSGFVKFKSYTNGSFFTKVDVTSYKNGIKTSSVSREIKIILSNCGANNPPTITSPFPYYNADSIEVFAGDNLSFSLTATDFQHNGLIPQYIKIEAVGDQFGSYIPASGGNQSTFSPTSGCSKPPCASLTAAPGPNNPLQAQFAITTQFDWQTSTNHLGLNQQPKWYFFKISFTDDYCPVPAQTNLIFKVLVKPPFYLSVKPKILNSKVLNSNSDVKITWGKCKDSINLFNSYEIYSSTTKNGTYNLVDSVLIVNDTSLIHLNTSAGNNEIFYFVKIKYLSNGVFCYSQNSDTVTTKFVDLEVIDTYVQFINPQHGYVRGTIKNNGNTTIDTLTLHYHFTQGPFLFPKTITWTGTLLANDTLQIPFSVDSISMLYTHTICTFVSHPKDYLNYNDSNCRVYSVGLENHDKTTLSFGIVHPTPTNGKLLIPIKSQKNETASFEIFNQQGMMIKSFKTQLNSGNNEIQIDLEKEENGVYFYVLEISGQRFFGKIVLVR